ncbi:TetR family transcriptional regulator [Actinomyces bowdenii]|uniref:TetR/AcrR family transcriptional regulator n=1 Tax=Actinomyces bowdenii TaxID=131109 RepID=A0A3P1V9H5_9ACTO|nr:TetR family transcriptional regulator [Actinomyces bowdenii]MBO3724612.1 TetR family transcriptional regulator [Actinomyces bowdenii]RRD30317.1 TetR/AcrR family transcriptional regulator [Actinomyces bowdenii]
MGRLGRKTGPKPGFTRADVITAALEIGVDSFTMAQVAARLGVRPSALYRTVASRDDVVEACLERISAGIRLPPAGRPWEDYLRGVVEAMWEALEAHPGLDRTLMSMPWTSLHLLGTAQRAHGELVAAGMDPREAYFALDVVIDTTVATHQAIAALRAPAQGQAGAGGEQGPLRGFDVLTRHWERMSGAQDPGGGEEVLFAPEESWLERGFLDLKIDLLIDGLRARQDRREP